MAARSKARKRALDLLFEADQRGLNVTTLLAAPVGAFAGPPLLPLVFGHDVQMAAGLTAVLASASTVAIAGLVMTLLLIALGRTGGQVRAWLVGAVPGAAYFALAPQPVLDRVCWTFLVVEVVAFGWMTLEQARGTASLAAS